MATMERVAMLLKRGPTPTVFLSILVGVVFCVTLVGCARAGVEGTATETAGEPSEKVAVTRSRPPATPTAGPSRAGTATLTLTASPEPLGSATIRPGPVHTPTATSTPLSSVITLGEPSISPDGRWMAEAFRAKTDGDERVVFQVKDLRTGSIWTVEDEPLEDEPLSGFEYVVPMLWTRDGEHLYVTHHRTAGDGCFVPGEHSGRGLLRLNLLTRDIVAVSSAVTSWMAISPDERHMAYVVYARQGLTIVDLGSGQEETLELVVSQQEMGTALDQENIVWSPDGNSLVFAVLIDVCGIGASRPTLVVRVDLPLMTQTVLVGTAELGYVPVKWAEPDVIILRDRDGQLWEVDVQTRALLQVD